MRRSLDLAGLFPGCPLGQPGPPSLPPRMGPASNSAATLTAEAPSGHIRGSASSQKPPVKGKFETKNLSAMQSHKFYEPKELTVTLYCKVTEHGSLQTIAPNQCQSMRQQNRACPTVTGAMTIPEQKSTWLQKDSDVLKLLVKTTITLSF